MTVAPRAWQAAFLERHRAHAGADFLLVATPGAGKTLAACEAVRASGCDQVVVVCPTTALRGQWADAADRVGLYLDPRWRNADGAWRDDVDGVVVTYQQVASAPDLFAVERTGEGPGARLDLVVSDGGSVRCDGHSHALDLIITGRGVSGGPAHGGRS